MSSDMGILAVKLLHQIQFYPYHDPANSTKKSKTFKRKRIHDFMVLTIPSTTRRARLQTSKITTTRPAAFQKGLIIYLLSLQHRCEGILSSDYHETKRFILGHVSHSARQ